MPDTRPDHVFEGGVCPACLNREPKIDWAEREQQLVQLLDRHHGEVLVPSSGGKDSTYQVLKLIEMGAHPTIVTATTCHLTDIGRKNIDNLSRYATTIEVSPNKTIRAKLNRLGLELVGDISWPEHVAIFSTPFNVSVELNIPLIMYGENPQHQYGGPKGSEEARIMTARWIQEFGGFLGLRPDDFEGKEGITERDMDDYRLPAKFLEKTEAHWLGQYERWDSRRNAKVAADAGMIQILPTRANWWKSENQDNSMTGLHDHLMYRKYGYGRGCTQISVDVREGIVDRDAALRWVHEYDGEFPFEYMGVGIDQILDRIGLSEEGLADILQQFTNEELFEGDKNLRPILK
jgi:hypothetical protein